MSLKAGRNGMLGLAIGKDDSGAISLEQIRTTLAGSRDLGFTRQRRPEVYAWVESTLARYQYVNLARTDKGLLRQYVTQMTGLSRAQTTRLIAGYQATGQVEAVTYQRPKFATRYTAVDLELLAYVDTAHGNLSGPATKRILEREHTYYGQAAYQRLAMISVAQLYRLRNSIAYRQWNTTYQPARPVVVRLGERRTPEHNGLPGHLRIDTEFRIDQDGRKGIYYVKAVDEVTQWEIVTASPRISELGLVPVLEEMLAQFPFVIRGFHPGHDSEYSNHTVARLLGKLLVEQTKPRTAILPNHTGFDHIGEPYAEAMNVFHRQHLNPYLNFHRPCAIPSISIEPNGKLRRTYKRWATPFELLQAVTQCEKHLRPGVTLARLEEYAKQQSDTEAAIATQCARRQLLTSFRKAAPAPNGPERRDADRPWTAVENVPRFPHSQNTQNKRTQASRL
jgi:hypothetical protein